jgi:hypothetical protein
MAVKERGRRERERERAIRQEVKEIACGWRKWTIRKEGGRKRVRGKGI